MDYESITGSERDGLQKIESTDHKWVKLAIVDIDGIPRGKYINSDKLLYSSKGIVGFCDVVFGWDSADACYDNGQLTGWHSGYPDGKVKVDLNSVRLISWDDNTPMVLGDYYMGDEAVCPRSLLKRIEGELEAQGMESKFSQEYEWFNFKENNKSVGEKSYDELETLTNGMFGYSLLRTSQSDGFVKEVLTQMDATEVRVEGMHTETGPGVYEACIEPDDALRAADHALFFKSGIKELMGNRGGMASFMAKWNHDLPGCGGHIHQSVWKRNENLFYGSEGELSKLGQHYLAGLLHCLPHILPMYAPTVNSYKRLVAGTWAPVNASWGYDNRTAAFRVINGKEQTTRIENRVPGSDINPYLAMAASLASGLYGIKHELPLNQPPVRGNAYEDMNAIALPSNLHEATQAMKQSEIATELFGETFVDHFIKTREWEWKQYTAAVSDWEVNRYFEII